VTHLRALCSVQCGLDSEPIEALLVVLLSRVRIYYMVSTDIKSLKLSAGGHVCNPSYSGGRDQEDLGLKPA
jgi:hypothetical protein